MKIGIMTNEIGHNYGGILQNYALQEILKRLGHEPSTIRWWSKNWYSYYRMLFGALRRNLIKKSPWPTKPNYIAEHRLGLWKFIKKYITFSTYSFFGNLKTLSRKFDAIIVGSDQVWRAYYIGNLETMFLDFVGSDTKKISYAASFGTDEWEFTQQQTTNCSILLKKFNHVSVREVSGVQLCKKYLNYDKAITTLDPTLLLNIDDYLKLIGRNDIESKPQKIFAYILDESYRFEYKLKELCSNLSMDLSLKGIEETLNINDTVEDWIQEFADASFVVTDSFHGCVFSIIFNIPFLVIGNSIRGNARIDSLLSQLNLTERKIYDLDEIDVENLTKPIDWISVNKKRAALKSDSIAFLRKSLDN